MSSLLIIPPEEISLQSYLELDNANYSIVTRGPDETAERLAFLMYLTSNKTGAWINTDLFIPRRLSKTFQNFL